MKKVDEAKSRGEVVQPYRLLLALNHVMAGNARDIQEAEIAAAKALENVI